MLKKQAVAMLAIITGTIAAGSAMAAGKDMTGKEIAYDRRLGNCLACHAMPNQPDADMPGNIAPPLISMKLRYPDKAKLRAQIWDAMAANPKTSMPPFGKHKVLTEEEIDKVTDFVYSL
jgi:sulfur-oxidizing protein SoxX